MPELDMPAHTESWGKGRVPEIHCGYKSVLQLVGGNASLVDGVVGSLITELTQVFPDALFHVGFDEVDKDCLLNDAQVQSYLETQDLPGQGERSFEKLLGDFFGRVHGLVVKQKRL